jgi:hypothetical protein
MPYAGVACRGRRRDSRCSGSSRGVYQCNHVAVLSLPKMPRPTNHRPWRWQSGCLIKTSVPVDSTVVAPSRITSPDNSLIARRQSCTICCRLSIQDSSTFRPLAAPSHTSRDPRKRAQSWPLVHPDLVTAHIARQAPAKSPYLSNKKYYCQRHHCCADLPKKPHDHSYEYSCPFPDAAYYRQPHSHLKPLATTRARFPTALTTL